MGERGERGRERKERERWRESGVCVCVYQVYMCEREREREKVCVCARVMRPSPRVHECSCSREEGEDLSSRPLFFPRPSQKSKVMKRTGVVSNTRGNERLERGGGRLHVLTHSCSHSSCSHLLVLLTSLSCEQQRAGTRERDGWSIQGRIHK